MLITSTQKINRTKHLNKKHKIPRIKILSLSPQMQERLESILHCIGLVTKAIIKLCGFCWKLECLHLILTNMETLQSTKQLPLETWMFWNAFYPEELILMSLMQDYILLWILPQKKIQKIWSLKLWKQNNAKINNAMQSLILKILDIFVSKVENFSVLNAQVYHGYMKTGIQKIWKDQFADH